MTNQGGYDPFQNQNKAYNPPVNNTNVNPIIITNNQPATTVVVSNDPFKFKTNSVLATCPSCKTSSNTNVTTSISISNLCCYIFCDPIVWVIYQLVRGKDLVCCDATHNCSGCGGFIASYQAC